jgi:poly(beta-D-mannuronate) C5 epimerase
MDVTILVIFDANVLLFVVGLSILLSPSVLVFVQAYAVATGCVNYEFHTNIITVSCNSKLSEIARAVNNRTVLEKDPHGVWILNATIKINHPATLTIDQSDTSWLKITNKNNNEPNFISVSGKVKIDGVKITSWDPLTSDVIRQNVKGSIPRPYIMIDKGSESANISNSEVAFLGYASNLGGANGFLYYYGGGGSSILNNTFHDMWDGFYSDSVGFITMKDNKYYNNLRYGIDPHSGSHDLSIIGNLVYNNSKIGIICSKDCYNILFSNNVVHDNGVAGLMFSLNTNNSVAKKNYAYNEKIGISIYQSSNNKIYDNLVKSSNMGIYLDGISSGNHIYNNTIMNGTVGFYLHLENNSRNNIYENNNLNNISQPIKR